MPEVSGLEDDSPQGEAIAKRRGEIFTKDFLPHLKPFKASDGLVAAVKQRGTLVPRSYRRVCHLRIRQRSPAL